MEEIWKDIPGFEGNFQVSNTGFIRSVGRFITDCVGRTRFYPPHVLKRHLTIGGYWGVKLKCVGLGITNTEMMVHRAVAAAFLGFDLNSDLVIDHVNGNKLDNSLGNLEAVTVAENNRRARVLIGEFKKGGVPSFTEEQAKEIREMYATGKYTKTKIAETYGVRLRYVCDLTNNKTHTNKFKRDGRTVKYKKFNAPDQTGELGHNSKLTNIQVCDIRSRNKNGAKQKDLAVEYGVSKQTICNIVNYKTYLI